MGREACIVELRGKDEILHALELLGGSLFDQSVNTPDALAALARKYAAHARALTVSDNGLLLGLCAYYDNDEASGRAYVSMLVVDGAAQRRGVGTILMADVLRRCAESRMRRVELEVARDNVRAIRFYEGIGLRLLGERGRCLLYGVDLGGPDGRAAG